MDLIQINATSDVMYTKMDLQGALQFLQDNADVISKNE